MTNKKTIHIVCKSNTEDKFRLAREFWVKKYDLNPSSQLFTEFLSYTDKQTLTSGECKWCYCPAYHFCPFSGEVLPGVKGRSDKKRIDVKFENIAEQSKIPSNLSDFNFRDGVTDEVVKGNGHVDLQNETL